jgi:hypothetical protein
MRALIAGMGLFAACAAAGCTADIGSEEDDLVDVEKGGKGSQKWIYNGLLPALDDATIVASLKGHTVRVSGFLPAGFTGELPFYADLDAAGDRERVTVVYPIATGKVDPSTGRAPAGPGDYDGLFAVPFTPTTSAAAWGGFPFMKYHRTRGLAFHGPITSSWDEELGSWQWRLRRGPVSHGCNRMQGEHVVELAHMLGMDMSYPHKSGETDELEVAVTIVKDYDVHEGQLVDVDYPVQPGVVRPTGNVRMFRTWDSNDFPRFVCAYDKKRAIDAHHCEYAGENVLDPTTGQ